MKRAKDVLRKLSFIIIVSLILIILLESENLYNLRSSVVLIVPFLNGKRELLSNVFLGIFASAFCMYIGEVLNFKHMKKDLEREIRQIFDELWIKLSFNNVNSKEKYMGNAKIILQYQDRIRNLYAEYTDKKSNEYYVIHYLHMLLTLYKSLDESEYMMNSNIYLFRDYCDELLKPINGDLKSLYSLSVDNAGAMKIKKDFEENINKMTKYIDDGNKIRDGYIEQIKKIEPYLEKLYNIQIKSRGIPE